MNWDRIIINSRPHLVLQKNRFYIRNALLTIEKLDAFSSSLYAVILAK